jgi:hypothetical protein
VTPLPTQVDVGDPPEIGIGTDAMHTSAALAEVVRRVLTYFRALLEAWSLARGSVA